MNRPLDQEILPDLLVIFSRVYKVDQDVSENSLNIIWELSENSWKIFSWSIYSRPWYIVPYERISLNYVQTD